MSAQAPIPQVQVVGPNLQGRDLAVGDIHGHFSALQTKLQRIGFRSEKDRLFAVGDLVDRGPESAQVLEWLDQPWFHAIAGNHELMTWRRALGQPLPGIDHRQHGGLWLDAIPAEQQAPLAERLRALPLCLEVATAQGPVGLVHADFPYDHWSAVHERRFSPADIDTCLWSIQRYRARYSQPIRGVRAVVHGHLTLPRMTQLGNVYYIDTGGGQAGKDFTLLDLGTLREVKR